MAGTTAYDGACACGGLIEAVPSPLYRLEQQGGGFHTPRIEYKVVEIDTRIVIMRTFHKEVAQRYCSERNKDGRRATKPRKRERKHERKREKRRRKDGTQREEETE